MSEPRDVQIPDLDDDANWLGGEPMVRPWWDRFAFSGWETNVSEIDRICGPEYRMAWEGWH